MLFYGMQLKIVTAIVRRKSTFGIRLEGINFRATLRLFSESWKNRRLEGRRNRRNRLV